MHPDDVQERRLAGARRPHDRDELSFFHVDVDPPQHVAAARAVRVRLLDVAKADQHIRRDRHIRGKRIGGGRGGGLRRS